MRELSMHILDLVQNSIEARASKVWLHVNEMISTDALVIKIGDNGRGMNQETVDRVVSPFVTTRTTRKVGLGLPLISMSTMRSDGFMVIESEIGKGTTVTAVYRHSHWDRPPLGDMAQTVKALLVANPALDFTYKHTVNTNSFAVSACEIAEILGDIPLDQPDVLLWLDDYLTQGIGNLYGGVDSEDG